MMGSWTKAREDNTHPYSPPKRKDVSESTGARWLCLLYVCWCWTTHCTTQSSWPWICWHRWVAWVTVRFLHFIKVLTNHNRALTRYIWYQWCSKMTGVMFYDKEYSCLSKLWSHTGVWQVLYYLYILKSIHLIKYIISIVKIYMLCIYIFEQ